MKNAWICNPDKAIRRKFSCLRRTITERLLPDLKIDRSPGHLLSAVNQTKNQLSNANRFRKDMLFVTDDTDEDFRILLDDVLEVYRDYCDSLEELMGNAQEALGRGQSEPAAYHVRDQLTLICTSILHRLAAIREEFEELQSDELQSTGLDLPIQTGNGFSERGSVPSEFGGDGRPPRAQFSPSLNQEETNGQPPAKG